MHLVLLHVIHMFSSILYYFVRFIFNNFVSCRIFESGSYKGYFRSYGKELLVNKISIPSGKTLTDVILVNVYTEWDVAAARQHRLKGKGMSIVYLPAI